MGEGPIRTALALLMAALVLGACGSDGAPDYDPIPATDTVIAVDGADLFVRRVGSGPPVLVVHGGPVLDHGYLVGPLLPLADRFEFIFYDQRLSGRSAGEVDPSTVTLEAFAADIAAIREALALETVHLLAHSWGGLVAMEYATTREADLRSLVLLSPIPPTTALWQQEQAAQQAALEPADTAGMGALRSSPGMAEGDPAVIERLLVLGFRGQFADTTLVDELDFFIPEDYMSRSRQFGAMMADLMDFDYTEALAALEVPVLLVYGGEEVGLTIGRDALVSAIPHTSAVAIAGVGHFPFIERPEEFRRVLNGFLMGVEHGN